MDLELIRKTASIEMGRRQFEAAPAPELSALAQVELQKIAAADQQLFTVATFLRPDDPLGMYEELGGGYSHEGRR